jgi:hypothetical protein
MMKQLWKIEDISKRIDKRTESDINKVVDVLYRECLAFARRAKNEHTYRNYKGELESSVGVVILKDRNEIKEWSAMASDGTDPARGLEDYKDVLSTYILGQESLPDGTSIPANSIAGIVFAAAPYSYEIEFGQNEVEHMMEWEGIGGKKVLHAFAPTSSEIFTVLKTVIQ